MKASSLSLRLFGCVLLLMPAWAATQSSQTQPVRLAAYLHGEARVTYRGKEYVFPIDTREGSRPRGLFTQTNSALKRVSLDYRTDDDNHVYFHTSGIGAPDGDPPSWTVYLYLDGKSVDLLVVGSCKVEVTDADAREMRATVTCDPRNAAQGLEKASFTATS